MKKVPVVIESLQDCNISVMILEVEEGQETDYEDLALTKAAEKVLADYADLDFDGDLAMSEIEGHCSPWRIAYIQNAHGQIEKLSVAQFWT